MFWYKVCKKIRTVLAKANVAPIVEIGAYNPDELNVDERGAVFVVKGGQPEVNIYKYEDGKITLYLECWIRYDGQDVGNAYYHLSKLEKKVINAIKDWIESGDDIFREGEQINGLTIDGILSDGDINRPYLGDAMMVNIEYLYVKDDE